MYELKWESPKNVGTKSGFSPNKKKNYLMLNLFRLKMYMENDSLFKKTFMGN